MIDIDIALLRGIGLTQPLIHRLLQLNPIDGTLMRVTEIQRDALRLHDGLREQSARALPLLVHALQADGEALAVGDWVLAWRNAQHELWAGVRVPPLTQLSRRNTYGQRQVLVSNVDTALLVMGLDQDFNLRRLERYLALARLAGVSAVVVLTKADACADAASRLAQVQAQLPASAPALAVNGLSPTARDALAPWLIAGHAGAARLQRRRQEHADQHAHRERCAAHRRRVRRRRARPSHDDRALAAPHARRRLHHRYAGPAHLAAGHRRGGARGRLRRHRIVGTALPLPRLPPRR